MAQSLYLALRVLHGQHIVIPRFWVDPETGRDHTVGGERGDHVVHHLAMVKAHLAGAHAVHVELQCRGVDVLRDENVGHSGNGRDLSRELERPVKRRAIVASGNLERSYDTALKLS